MPRPMQYSEAEQHAAAGRRRVGAEREHHGEGRADARRPAERRTRCRAAARPRARSAGRQVGLIVRCRKRELADEHEPHDDEQDARDRA